jgi:hypothetical protein
MVVKFVIGPVCGVWMKEKSRLLFITVRKFWVLVTRRSNSIAAKPLGLEAVAILLAQHNDQMV